MGKNRLRKWYHFSQKRVKIAQQKWYHCRKGSKILNKNGKISEKVKNRLKIVPFQKRVKNPKQNGTISGSKGSKFFNKNGTISEKGHKFSTKMAPFQKRVKNSSTKIVPFQKRVKNRQQKWYHFSEKIIKIPQQKWYHFRKGSKILI